MKKRKTYEISVIDKTYSKIISDETKFYTSDTALELGFELKETEYKFESAEIVLLNIDDRSLVTRPVAKVDNDFVYEIDDDITTHYGEWRGQLRFEKDGEVYVSSRVEFRIENDLSDERPPQLSDVQSWVSLKRYADSLTEELKQAVLSVEGIEDTFNENELGRQSQFANAEQARQTAFETNESERDETFNTNEDIRQTQELEREKAESKRQTVFDDNEANRTETFNTNEATRQENENTRQEAETQRVSAESSRVSAEAQRKIDHESRSTELAGKADKVVLRNIAENGDFSDVLTGWGSATGALPIVIEGRAYFERTPDTFPSLRQNIPLSPGDVIYSRLDVEHMQIDNTATSIYGLFNNNGLPVTIINFRGLPLGSRTVSHRWTVDKVGYFYINSALNASFYLDNIQVINLTKTFGAGNEPAKEEMDELIKVTGYIDGEYALNNREMLIWTLALIRRNKNAIITLGGTI